MQSTIRKYASKACALAAAAALCCSLAVFAFSRPVMPVKADFGDFASDLDYALLGGFTSAQAADNSFGVALGSQIMLIMIAQQCAQERAQNPGATFNFSNFKGFTGWYQLPGDSKYYPCTIMLDKNMNQDSFSRYPALDGGIQIVHAAHYSVKWFPSSGVTYLATSDSPTIAWLCNGSVGSSVVSSVNAIGGDDIFGQDYATFTSNSIRTYVSPSGSVPVYDYDQDFSKFFGFNNAVSPSKPICGVFTTPMPVSTPLYDVEITPENVKDVYDDYIIPSYPPEYLLFPDGFPEPEEPTEETTEGDTGYQPFTLPPPWLETYPTPFIPDPSIPDPSDAVPPTVNVEIQRNGLNFWADLWTELIDKTGLGSYIVILLGLSILEWLLWHAGNGGNGKGGEQ